MDLGNGLAVRYTYDFLGRLAALETPAGKISYEYLAGQGQTIRTLPNGIRTVWEYQPNGNLKSIIHVGKDNYILAKSTYSYRADGLISSVKEWSSRGEKEIQYGYDKVQRLSTVKDSAGTTIQYRYDKMGNRLARLVNGQAQSTGTYNWAGQMVQLNGQAVIHDKSGNLTSYADSQGNRAFEYNKGVKSALDLFE